MKKVRSIITLLLFYYGSCIAQDAKADFERINKRYDESRNIEMKVKYELYQDYTGKTPFQTMEGEVKRAGDYMIFKLGPMEVIHNSRFEVIVDQDEKEIALLEHKTKLFDWNNKLFLSRFDQTLKLYEKVDFHSDKNSATYDLKPKSGGFSRIIIHFDKTNYTITGMVLYYRVAQILNEDGVGKKDTPRIEINYSDIKLNPGLKKEEFSENKYVALSGGKYVCTPSYQGYKLRVEMLNKNLK
jgi:outer membrane lipoprotein-sorting protein